MYDVGTLQYALATTSNDYSSLEEIYRARTGSELVQDPYASVYAASSGLTLSASVIIPAFNSRSTLELCLLAIEQSTFNRQYPEQLEVIVVDDGSSDGTWEFLEQQRLKLRLKAIRQDHAGSAHARNSALAYAEGDIVICCDSDIILTPFALTELMKRHQWLDNVLLVGFRGNINQADPRLQPHILAQHLADFLPPFAEDFRVAYPIISTTRSLQHWKAWGQGKKLFLPVVPWMDLPQLVWGALFSLPRADFYRMGGFNEAFRGWGFEDSLIGAHAIAQGKYIIPVYSAAGLHIEHTVRLPGKWQSYAFNYQVYQTALHAPPEQDAPARVKKAQERVKQYLERSCAHEEISQSNPSFLAPFDAIQADPYRRGNYFYELGRYNDALAAFEECHETSNLAVTFALARTLRASGQPEEAMKLLPEVTRHWPERTEPLLETMLALAALSRFQEASKLLPQVRASKPCHTFTPLVSNFMCDVPADLHRETARLYAQQGDYAQACQEGELALILHPLNLLAQAERARILHLKGEETAARTASDTALQSAEEGTNADLLQHIWPYLISNAYEEAASMLETHGVPLADEQLAQLRSDIQDLRMQLRPLPLSSQLIAQGSKIAGPFAEEELELLTAATLIVATRRVASSLTALVDIGSFCGQATITMGLTLRAVACEHARIFARDDEPAPEPVNERLPWPEREMLMPARARLNKYRSDIYQLTDLISCVPEEGNIPPEYSVSLILANQGYAPCVVEDALTTLVPAGLLLLYRDPGSVRIQQWVDGLLETPLLRLIARAGHLIALEKQR